MLLVKTQPALRVLFHAPNKFILIGWILVCLTACQKETTLAPFTSDGCSLFPDRSLISEKDWCECCFDHDITYWQGGTKEARLKADEALRDCVFEKTGDRELAELMYHGVRVGGSPFFHTWYRWGYGWNDGRNYQELSEEEKQLIKIKLAEGLAEAQENPCDEPS